MPIPAQVKALMRQTVEWEHATGKDAYGDESYAAAVTLACHIELATEAERSPEETRFVPQNDLYFDGGDTRVETFELNDRFTIAGIAGGQPLQAKAIDPVYGPDGDVWTVRVTVG